MAAVIDSQYNFTWLHKDHIGTAGIEQELKKSVNGEKMCNLEAAHVWQRD
jgi:hypothetical protein